MGRAKARPTHILMKSEEDFVKVRPCHKDGPFKDRFFFGLRQDSLCHTTQHFVPANEHGGETNMGTNVDQFIEENLPHPVHWTVGDVEMYVRGAGLVMYVIQGIAYVGKRQVEPTHEILVQNKFICFPAKEGILITYAGNVWVNGPEYDYYVAYCPGFPAVINPTFDDDLFEIEDILLERANLLCINVPIPEEI